MESIVKKSLSSLLIVVMLFTMAMPAMVNAAKIEKPEAFTEKELLNKIVYFEGQTYSSLQYDVDNAKSYQIKEVCPEDTAGIVFKLNKKYDTLVVLLSNGKFRTIKYDQVSGMRDSDFIQVNFDRGTNLKDMKFDLSIMGEENQIVLQNGTDIVTDFEGRIALGFENGFSKLTITRNGKQLTDIFIIEKANGKVVLDVDEKVISADVATEMLEIMAAGGEVKLALEDNKIVLAAGAEAGKELDEDGKVTGEYVSADAEAVYTMGDNDIEVGAEAAVMGHKIGNINNKMRVVEKITSLINRLRALF